MAGNLVCVCGYSEKQLESIFTDMLDIGVYVNQWYGIHKEGKNVESAHV